MPNEVGQILQIAQDDLQRVSGDPLYLSFSTDALGANRRQVLDSNWKVCSQTPSAGTTVTATTIVSFDVVKLTEQCP
ncbi:hypothetical protein [Yimella lutea]|uniref:hypothetical protein n=1 Tax=Yimella lutea TaxID=587872 RepID=UPI001FE924B8|nr:hypothetical protein [Yimella lutea]